MRYLSTWPPAPLENPWFAERLFDLLPDTVFFVKDRLGCYQVVNQTLVQRCGFRHKSELLGRTAMQVFPEPLGSAFAAQDQWVLEGRSLVGRLELHLYPNHVQGWCLTHKFPLYDMAGQVVALTGISRDLHHPNRDHRDYAGLAGVVEAIEKHYAQPLRISRLAQQTGWSQDTLQRRFERVWGLTPQQFLLKTRLQAAMQLLQHSSSTVAEVALVCGYTDQSAFTRQFKAVTGLTPKAYRQQKTRP